MPRSEACDSRSTWALATVTVVLCLSLGAAPARASRAGLGAFPDERTAVSIWLGCNAVIFGGLDLAFLIAWRPTPPALSWLQIVIGGAVTPALAFAAPGDAALHGAAIASIVGHVGIGVANLLAFPAFRERRERERKGISDPYTLALEPHPNGGLLRFRAQL